MAHEMSHVSAHHAARQMTRQQFAQFVTIPLIVADGSAGYGAYEAASLGMPLAFIKFSGGFETRADYLGVQYLYKAGYDPSSFIGFFEKLEATARLMGCSGLDESLYPPGSIATPKRRHSDAEFWIGTFDFGL